jgi:hypothetical protein
MKIQIVEVSPQSFHVVDMGIPGGRTMEHHSSRERAEIAAARWGYQPLTVQASTADPSPPSTPEIEGLDLDALAAFLQRSAWTVLAEVKEHQSAAELSALEALETDGRGRSTVIKAIRDRLEALGS